jgi:enoyl-CoA hydratase
MGRPPLNALNDELSDGLRTAFEQAASREEVRALVLTGGPKVFAAGADVNDMAEADPPAAAGHVDRLSAAINILAAIPKVTIAVINGFALGGGLELSLGADFRYASNSARLGQPEIQLGIIPGAGGTQRLPRLVGLARAREMIYTGRHVKADEALEIGLVDRVAPPDEVLDLALQDAARFAQGPLVALAAAKRSIDEGSAAPLAEGLRIEREAFLALFETRDQKAGMRSLLENGPGKAKFEGR